MEKFLGLVVLFAVILLTSCDSGSIAEEQILFENAAEGDDQNNNGGREGDN